MNQDEINLDSINYRGIIRDLLKNWWIIVLIVISLYLAATGIGKDVYKRQILLVNYNSYSF